MARRPRSIGVGSWLITNCALAAAGRRRARRRAARRPPTGRSRPRPGRRRRPLSSCPNHSPRTCTAQVAHRARVRVHLGGDRREEAAARVDAALDVLEEALGELPQPLEAGGGSQRRLDHLLGEEACSPSRSSRAAAPPWSRNGRRGRSCSSPPPLPAGRSRARRCPRPWRAVRPRAGSRCGSAHRRCAACGPGWSAAVSSVSVIT